MFENRGARCHLEAAPPTEAAATTENLRAFFRKHKNLFLKKSSDAVAGVRHIDRLPPNFQRKWKRKNFG